MPAASRWRRICCLRRARPAASPASARATSTAWVLEARSSHQPSSVRDAHAVDRVDLGALRLEARLDLVDHRELALVRAVEADLRRVDQRRHAVAPLGERGVAAGQDAEQADRDVERVVVAVEAVGVEDVAGHLAGERRAALGHLGLDQRMPGLPHDRLPAEARDLVEQRLARLDVGDDRRARMARQHLGREDLHQLVAEHDPALAVDHADPIAIAVEGDADLGAARRRPRPIRSLEVLVDRRIGVMVGEAAVDLGEQQLMPAGQAARPARSAPRRWRRCRHPTPPTARDRPRDSPAPGAST